jgi:hypothetical protein
MALKKAFPVVIVINHFHGPIFQPFTQVIFEPFIDQPVFIHVQSVAQLQQCGHQGNIKLAVPEPLVSVQFRIQVFGNIGPVIALTYKRQGFVEVVT